VRQLHQADHLFLREEFVWLANQLDPFAFSQEHGLQATAELLHENLLRILEALAPSQVLNFRGLDLRSDERAQFGTGGGEVEPNPQLGWHGVRRLLDSPEYLGVLLRVTDDLAATHRHQLVFSLPFLTLESELLRVLSFHEATCTHGVQLGVFVETPASVLELPWLVQHNLAAVYVGTKDLAQLIMGADRGNGKVAAMLSLTNRPIVEMLRTAVDCCFRNRVPVFVFSSLDEAVSLHGQLPGLYGLSLPAAEFLRGQKTTSRPE
jgi:pyruvate,water dikinase